MVDDRTALMSAKALTPGYEVLWYTIDRVLGQGGFGITYLAHDRNLDRAVAIKEYLPTSFAFRQDDYSVKPITGDHRENFVWGLGSFLKEAQTLARFSHRNIVRVHSVFEENNTAYMVMEYEHGQNLSRVYKQGGQLDQAFFEQIFFPIMDGLKEIHKFEFIHRDIKPANIYIREDGTPVLIDFGSARQTTQQQTGEMTTLVSQGYTPLEQYSANYGDQGPWTDIYAMAATIHEGIVGRKPDESLSRSACLMRAKPDLLQRLDAQDHPGFSQQFLDAVHAGLKLEPEGRPQSLEEWRRGFDEGIHPQPLGAGMGFTQFDDDDRTRIQPRRPAPEPAMDFDSFTDLEQPDDEDFMTGKTGNTPDTGSTGRTSRTENAGRAGNTDPAPAAPEPAADEYWSETARPSRRSTDAPGQTSRPIRTARTTAPDMPTEADEDTTAFRESMPLQADTVGPVDDELLAFDEEDMVRASSDRVGTTGRRGSGLPGAGHTGSGHTGRRTADFDRTAAADRPGRIASARQSSTAGKRSKLIPIAAALLLLLAAGGGFVLYQNADQVQQLDAATLANLPNPETIESVQLPREAVLDQLDNMTSLAPMLNQAWQLSPDEPVLLDTIRATEASLIALAQRWNASQYPGIADRIRSVSQALPADIHDASRVDSILSASAQVSAYSALLSLLDEGQYVMPAGNSVLDRITAVSANDYRRLRESDAWKQMMSSLSSRALQSVTQARYEDAARLAEVALTLDAEDSGFVALRSFLQGS